MLAAQESLPCRTSSCPAPPCHPLLPFPLVASSWQSRGMLSTIYVQMTPGTTVEDLRQRLVERYAVSPTIPLAFSPLASLQ